jgi:hypothetical protein
MQTRTLTARLPIALALAAVAAADAPALADDAGSTWTIDIGTQTRYFGDTSAAALTPEPMLGPQLTVGRHLVGLPGPRGGFDLAGFIRVTGGQASGLIFNSLGTQVDQLAFTGGARLDLAVWRGFGASAKLDLGAARTAVVIGDNLGAMAPVDDSAWGFLGAATLGVKYDGVVRGHYTIGLAFDVGYTVAAPVALHAYPRSRPEEELSISTMYTGLGALDTRGLTLGFTLRGGI